MKKCFKEWNAIIEALGQGKQSILVRRFTTSNNKFLLYPTVSYATKKGYLDMFQEEYENFVKENTLPNANNSNVEIKYLASVENIKKVSIQKIVSLQKYYIWNKNHVKSYLKDQKSFIWLLRIYKLPKPVMAESKRAAITFADLNQDISIEKIEPVLSDKEFSRISKKI